MLSPQALFKGIISAFLPNKGQDGPEAEGALRLNEYREIIQQLSRHSWAKEGSYFATPNPTLGTAQAGAISAAFVNTTALFVIYNTQDPSSPTSKNIDLDMVKLQYIVAPASATGFEYAVVLDNVSRQPTAGLIKLTPNQVGKIFNTSNAAVWGFQAGLLTVPAPGQNARTVARGSIPGLPVVGTEHMIQFGLGGPNSAGATQEPPVSIPPGFYAVVHGWWPGNAITGPSAEYLLGHIER
jgi:hypothetical protein